MIFLLSFTHIPPKSALQAKKIQEELANYFMKTDQHGKTIVNYKHYFLNKYYISQGILHYAK